MKMSCDIHGISRRALLLAAVMMVAPGAGWAADPGKETIGEVKVDLIFGTDSDLGVLGRTVARLDAAEEKVLAGSKSLHFTRYGKLGSDRKPVWRGYENWAAPMGGSQEILLSFEPKGQVGTDALKMDLEFWQRKQKVLKTDPVLRLGKRLYILGPKWRDGRLIIAIELLRLESE